MIEKDASLQVLDSITGKYIEEKIWGKKFIDFLYGAKGISRLTIREMIAKMPWISKLWGSYNNLSSTRKKILPFCQKYDINTEEFEKPISSFTSFNDFFIRSLKKSARPIDQDPLAVTAPADARYTFIPNLSQEMPFTIKGSHFQLDRFLQNSELASYYDGGVGIIARLCPTDCHRYFFPMSGKLKISPQIISGSLYSVSPIATSLLPWIWWENKRVRTTVTTPSGLLYTMVEIGATNCGSIIQTFDPQAAIIKGEEKGYFLLGGSAVMLLFPKNSITIDPNLLSLQNSHQIELFCHYGQKIAIQH